MAIDDSLLTSTGQGQNPLEATLDQWSNETIKKLKESLAIENSSGTSGKLTQSIEAYPIQQTENGISVTIVAEDYYKYIDQGVQGVGGENKTKGGTFPNVAPNSPFSYKQGFKPSAKHFDLWSRVKGLNPFAVRESVFRKGLTPSYFYSKVMTDEWLDELSRRLEVAGAGTVEIILKENIENGNNN